MMSKQFYLPMLTMYALCTQGALRADMFDVMRKMNEQMNRIHQEFDTLFSTMTYPTRQDNSSRTVNYTDHKEELCISIPIKKDLSTIEAKTKGNHTIIIQVPELGTSIHINAKKNRFDTSTVFVTIEYHQKEVHEEENKKYQQVAFGSETSSHTINGILDASQALVEYTQENLIIRLPKQQLAPDEKKLLVTMSKSEDNRQKQEK